MTTRRSKARPGRAALPLVAALTALGCSAPVAGSTPSLTWQGATRVGVQCVVTSTAYQVEALRTALCERVRALAAAGAPTAVDVIPIGDPALLQAGTVTLLVHGSVLPASEAAPGAQGRMLAFTIRPFRVSEQNSILYGSAPRAVSLPASGAEGAALDAALGAALAETLPWRAAQSAAPRPLTQQR